MLKTIFCVAVAALVLAVPAGTQSTLPYLTQPSISPDNSEIAFASAGAVWAVPASGGDAHLLVSRAANESRPLYSPDGKRLAFVSTRTGNGDIYILTFATGDLKRITFDDAPDELDAWSRDGRWIYFSNGARDVSYDHDVYRVSADGGTPMPVTAETYVNEYFSAPSPDGKMLAFTARGIVSEQWWRKGHSHLDESEVWLMHDGTPQHYEELGEGGDAKELWPMWSADGQKVYYVSDAGGAANIWARSTGGKPEKITSFRDGRVIWPTISYDGRTIVFERDFRVWELDIALGQAAPVAIALRGAPEGPAVEHQRYSDKFTELALAPDGKKVAFVVHGEIFAASAKDGGDAFRVTHTPQNESSVTWLADSRRIVYESDRDGATHLFLYDFGDNKETQLTNAGQDASPIPSPDGKTIAFLCGGHELRAVDADGKNDRLLATGYFDTEPNIDRNSFAWSPDNKWIAYLSYDARLYRNVSVVPAAGGESKPVSFIADTQSGSIGWSTDGTYLLFGTSQRTEPHQIARIDLVPHTPKFHEDQFRDLFKEETPKSAPSSAPAKEETKAAEPNAQAEKKSAEEKKPAPKPVVIDFEGIRERLTLLRTGLDGVEPVISPDGKLLLFAALVGGQVNLYTYSLDELSKEPAVARQLTSTPESKDAAQFTPDGKEVFYLEDGKISSIAVESRQAKPLAVSAEMDVDFARDKMEVFTQAWTYLRDMFFDPNFNGVNWAGVRSQYEPLIAGSRTPEEMGRLMNLMVGELNSSHSGFRSGSVHTEHTTGYIGVRFDRALYESSGRLRITEVVPLGPAAVAGIKAGDEILSVDGVSVGPHTNFDQLLDHTIGRRVVLKLARDKDSEVAVRPIRSESDLLYRQWVAQERAYIEKISGGKLGYVHMEDMSAGSLEQLYIDLDSQNEGREGVVVDVRGNNGGFVNVYAIDVLARRNYLNMTPRGLPEATARPMLGQRALERPTILVTNRESLSDAEDFTEGYRSLHLGKVVGEPTAGWIIYTSGTELIDGSILRLPEIRISTASGEPMEMHPRPVDIAVTRPVGESLTGRDSQLDAAVRELLEEIASKK
ncbi:MAG TPA: S41 family peptidase [Candidatus Acidoferrum sp.]|nr:S41 family peptidase [Candidatus Acidoferrum sp.]